MKITVVWDFDSEPVIFLKALDMSRACSPICWSAMSPSNSAASACLSYNIKVQVARKDWTSGSEGCNGVDHYDVNGGGPYQLIHHIQSHLARVRLTDEQVFNIHSQWTLSYAENKNKMESIVDSSSYGIGRIQGMLSVNEGSGSWHRGWLKAVQNSVNCAEKPPLFWTSATAWRASVDLPLLSGPYISMTLPRGKPPPSIVPM